MRLRIAIGTLAALVALPLTAAAQLVEGVKVRATVTGELAAGGGVTAGSGRRSIVGRFLSIDADNLILSTESGSKTIHLPKAAVSELEISRGRSRLKGALIGAGIGAITGVGWGAVERSRCLSQHGFLCDLSFIGPVIVVPPVGAIVGLLIGKPQWRGVPVIF